MLAKPRSNFKNMFHIQSNESISRWVNGNNLSEYVTYLPWAFDQPNGQASQKCVSYDFDRDGYNDEDCSTKMCIPCQLHKEIFFQIRGFPEEIIFDTVDVDYILTVEVEKVSFEGFSGLSSIFNNINENVWQLLSNGTAIGHYNGTSPIPIGFNEWYLYNTTFSKVQLKLSQVICITLHVQYFCMSENCNFVVSVILIENYSMKYTMKLNSMANLFAFQLINLSIFQQKNSMDIKITSRNSFYKKFVSCAL